MLMFKRKALIAAIAASFLASAVLPAAAHPAGGFHGGMAHMPAGGFHGGMAHMRAPMAAGHIHGPGPALAPGHPEFHPQLGAPHMAPPHAGSRPHNGPGWGGPSVRQPYRPPPPYRYPPPPMPYYGGPYYGSGWYGPYGPGWGWNGNAWVPFAAFGAGALVGGGVAAATQNNSNTSSEENPSINPKHYQWCEQHYKSYRASDNTYQPYHGPRKQCLSPYY